MHNHTPYNSPNKISTNTSNNKSKNSSQNSNSKNKNKNNSTVPNEIKIPVKIPETREQMCACDLSLWVYFINFNFVKTLHFHTKQPKRILKVW
jgi:hypothetical protein